MKAFFHFTVPLLAIITMVACAELEVSEDANDAINNGILQELSITGKDFIFDDETRSTVAIGDGGASFTWDEDDVIGIFPDKGDQVSFAMDEGAGTQTATFSGGGWALKSSAKYAAYYPHVYENRDLTKIPVSYVGQIQNGNANTDHIGAYDFMAAGVSTPENGAVAFDMQHLGALIQLTITVPEPSTLTKVVLTSSTEFTETGTIDLTAGTPAITAVIQSNTFEIAFNNITTTEANENVTVYFMVAPIDLTDSELTATIHFADETTSEVELAGKNLQAGKAYRLTAEIEKTIPNNQIWYTSGDGNVIIPKNTSAFGSDIISNVYENGKGTITFKEDINIIGTSAFYGSQNLLSIIIPNAVNEIGKSAFANCTSLTEVIIPNSVISIVNNDVSPENTGAFTGCTSLTNINIPSSVTSIGHGTFSGCTQLKSIIIPNSVVSLGKYIFKGCSNLTTVNLSNKIDAINTGAFWDCTSLQALELPASVNTIAVAAFINVPLSQLQCNAPNPPTLNASAYIPAECIVYVPAESVTDYQNAENWNSLTIKAIQ